MMPVAKSKSDHCYAIIQQKGRLFSCNGAASTHEQFPLCTSHEALRAAGAPIIISYVFTKRQVRA